METEPTTVFTIGFTRKGAKEFFETLRRAGVRRVLDVRLNNVSQLAGFSKRDDLSYFLTELLHVPYQHLPILAPTKPLLDDFKKRKGDWDTYERGFLELMEEREIEKNLDLDLMDGGCLLCSEDKPHHCHRRLVAEYLNRKWGNVKILHLG